MPRRPTRNTLSEFQRIAETVTKPKPRRRKAPKPTRQTQAIVKTGATRLNRAMVAAAKETAKKTNTGAVTRALTRRDVDAAVLAIPFDTQLEPLLTASHAEMFRFVLDSAATVNGESVGLHYSVLSPRSLDAMRREGARFITEISETTRDNVRGVLVDMLNRGMSARESAKEIERHIGLNARLSQAVENYRAKLIEQGLPDERISKMVARKADQLLRYRATAIARTEANRAVSSASKKHGSKHERKSEPGPDAEQIGLHRARLVLRFVSQPTARDADWASFLNSATGVRSAGRTGSRKLCLQYLR